MANGQALISRHGLKLAHVPEKKPELGIDTETVDEEVVGTALRAE